MICKNILKIQILKQANSLNIHPIISVSDKWKFITDINFNVQNKENIFQFQLLFYQLFDQNKIVDDELENILQQSSQCFRNLLKLLLTNDMQLQQFIIPVISYTTFQYNQFTYLMFQDIIRDRIFQLLQTFEEDHNVVLEIFQFFNNLIEDNPYQFMCKYYNQLMEVLSTKHYSQQLFIIYSIFQNLSQYQHCMDTKQYNQYTNMLQQYFCLLINDFSQMTIKNTDYNYIRPLLYSISEYNGNIHNIININDNNFDIYINFLVTQIHIHNYCLTIIFKLLNDSEYANLILNNPDFVQMFLSSQLQIQMQIVEYLIQNNYISFLFNSEILQSYQMVEQNAGQASILFHFCSSMIMKMDYINGMDQHQCVTIDLLHIIQYIFDYCDVEEQFQENNKSLLYLIKQLQQLLYTYKDTDIIVEKIQQLIGNYI